MPRDISLIRNIGIVAHIDAGKTTLTERMLYYGHFIHRVGMVDEGTTTTDYDPEEQERGITILAACVTFDWKGYHINLIDTPGHVDFTAEVERSLRVLDGAVVVFSAREGVEAQSETVWRQADRYRIPRLAFVNKMDREGADFEGTVEEIRERLECRPVPVNIPIGAGPAHYPHPFAGVIDLIRMKALRFEEKEREALVLEEEIPEALRETAALWRMRMLDQLSLYSDRMTEVLLAEEEVPEELIHQVLRLATVQNMVVPLTCGTALHGIGVQPVLDAVVRYLPSPADIPPVDGHDVDKPDRKLTRKADVNEPFCGLVFKVQPERYGDLDYVRVYSGRLKANSRVLNPGKNKKENVPQLWRIQADRREQIEAAEAGDIVGIMGMRYSITGDTLCDPKHPILLESIVFPETVVDTAIEPETAADRKKLIEVLELMKRQDPTFRYRDNEETGQILISGMGELHLEVITHRLLREYRLQCRVQKPRVSYRETIEKAAEAVGQCHRNLGGRQLWAELSIRMEPFPQGAKPVVVIPECGDALPPPFLQAAWEALEQHGEGGGLLGFPLMHVKVSILGGRVHETDSSEPAFRIAAADAFEKALRMAGVVLLEPIMKVEVTVPEEFVGDVLSDLQQRRGEIVRTAVRGKNTIIEARAPLANLFGYSNAVRGLSQGRASATMEPLTYGPAPADVLANFL